QRAAALEQQTRRIDIDAPAEVEIRLGFAAHHGGKVEHAVCAVGECSVDERRITEVAGDGVHARVRLRGRAGDVDERNVLDRSLLAARISQVAASEQCGGELAAEKSGAAGDDNTHASCSWSRPQYHNRPSRRPPASLSSGL